MISRFWHMRGPRDMVLTSWVEMEGQTWEDGDYSIPEGQDAPIDLVGRSMWHSAKKTEIAQFLRQLSATWLALPAGAEYRILLKRGRRLRDHGILQIRQSMPQDDRELLHFNSHPADGGRLIIVGTLGARRGVIPFSALSMEILMLYRRLGLT